MLSRALRGLIPGWTGASSVRLALLASQTLLASCSTTTIVNNLPSGTPGDASPAFTTDGATDTESSNATLDATTAPSDGSSSQDDAPNDSAVVALDSTTAQVDAVWPGRGSLEAATDSPTARDVAIDGGRPQCDENGLNCRLLQRRFPRIRRPHRIAARDECYGQHGSVPRVSECGE